MKTAGCLFVCVILLVSLSLAVLYALRQFRPTSLQTERHKPPPPEPEVPGTEPRPDPDVYATWVDSLGEFSSSETNDSYRLKYGFIDHHGKTQKIECAIGKADHLRESAAFGFSRSELKAEQDRRLQVILNRELARRNLTEYMKVRAEGGGGYKWEYTIPAGLDPETHGAVLGRAKEMVVFMENEYPRRASEIRDELYQRHGFLIRGKELVIDHGSIVLRNQLPLSDCFGSLLRAGRGYNERQYLGLFLAFYQEIRYEAPPDEINGKFVLGLYVPTEVLVNNHGDCDSKSLSFAAMMRSWMKPSLVIDLPDHVLVGVETRPGPGQQFVRLGNRYFVMCEVAGPGKLAPGNRGKDNGESGYFNYTLIDPVSSDLQRGAQ